MWKIFEITVTVVETLYLFYFLYGNELKRSKISLFIAYISFTIFVIAMNSLGTSSYINVLAVILYITIVFRYFYKISNLKFLVNISIYMIILSISELLVMGLIMNIKQQYYTSVFFNASSFRVEAIILSKTLTIILLTVFKRHQLRKIQKFDYKEFILILMPMVIGLAITLFCIGTLISVNLDRNHYYTTILIIIPLLILFETISSVIFTDYYLKEKQKSLDLEAIHYREKCQMKYYKSKKETETEIRKIYHDLKNYMIYLKKCSPDDQAIDTLLEPLKVYESYIPTNNEILDTLINEKYRIAKNKHIEFDCIIDFTDGSFINPLDICAIFGNLLDNAIEGCKKIEDIERRYIDIKASTINNFIVVKIVNSKNEEILLSDNHVRTTKGDKRNHGYGLYSIKESIKKYEGEFSIVVNENEFIANILIPLNR